MDHRIVDRTVLRGEGVGGRKHAGDIGGGGIVWIHPASPFVVPSYKYVIFCMGMCMGSCDERWDGSRYKLADASHGCECICINVYIYIYINIYIVMYYNICTLIHINIQILMYIYTFAIYIRDASHGCERYRCGFEQTLRFCLNKNKNKKTLWGRFFSNPNPRN